MFCVCWCQAYYYGNMTEPQITLIPNLPDIILATDTFWDGTDWKVSFRSSAFCCKSFSNINAFKEVKTKNGTIPLNAMLNPTKYI